MKLIVALIKPYKVEDVKNALQQLPLGGLTLTESRGSTQTKPRTGQFRGVQYAVDLVPKAKIEIVVTDETAELVANTIAQAAHTGRPGDGRVFLLSLADAVRIRTEEHGDAAL